MATKQSRGKRWDPSTCDLNLKTFLARHPEAPSPANRYYKVQSLGLRVSGLGCRAYGLGFTV